MKRKAWYLIILAMIMIVMPVKIVFADSIPPVIVNNQELKFDVSPRVVNQRILVPCRTIAEAIGATVTWDAPTQRVTCVKDGNQIVLQLGNSVAIVNNKNVNMDVAPIAVKGRLLIPVRFFCESFGLNLSYVRNFLKGIAEIEIKDKATPDFVINKANEILTESKTNYILNVYDSRLTDKNKTAKKFKTQTGKVRVDVKFTTPPVFGGIELTDETGKKIAVAISCDDGYAPHKNIRLTYSMFGEESAIAEFAGQSPRTMSVTIIANIATQKADVYLNGVLKLSNKKFLGSVDNIGSCVALGNTSLDTVCAVDDFGTPEELDTTDISDYTVKPFEFQTGYADCDAYTKDFLFSSGKLLIDLDFKDPGYEGGFALYDESGEKPAICIKHAEAHMGPNNWFLMINGEEFAQWPNYNGERPLLGDGRLSTGDVHIVLIVDLTTQTTDVYVNGKKEMKQVPFRQKVSNLSKCTMYGTAVLDGLYHLQSQ